MQGRGVEDRPGSTLRGTDGDREASFGAMLKRLRDAAGLTQEELAFDPLRTGRTGLPDGWLIATLALLAVSMPVPLFAASTVWSLWPVAGG